MDVTYIGIDLAKQVFQIHGVDHHGKGSSKETATTRSDAIVLPQAGSALDRHGSLG